MLYKSTYYILTYLHTSCLLLCVTDAAVWRRTCWATTGCVSTVWDQPTPAVLWSPEGCRSKRRCQPAANRMNSLLHFIHLRPQFISS